jgi:hypothetical protein
MKYRKFFHPSHIAYEQVEEDVYEERECREIIGIEILSITREERENIDNYCNENHIYHISNLIYFDNIYDRIQFLLHFGG